MNLLYHKKYGIVCAATTAGYDPTEPLNQQYLRKKTNPPCMTAQMIVDDEYCCFDKDAVLSYKGTEITAKGEKWSVVYEFTDDRLEITASSENGVYSLPIVCGNDTKATLSADGKCLSIAGSVTVTSSEPITVDLNKRVFHQVGGLSYLPVLINVKETAKIILN
jgi:hypothetical protein